jgi:hypothetical protein
LIFKFLDNNLEDKRFWTEIKIIQIKINIQMKY